MTLKEPPAALPAAKPKAPHYAGHRDRLRARLLEVGAEALRDDELIELMLFAAIPRRDVKPLAKKLLENFRDLGGFMAASPDALEAAGLGAHAAAFVAAMNAMAVRAKKSAVMDKPLLSNWQRILDYCRAAMARETKEQFRILFFDRRNYLIGDEVQQRGTIDHTPVYPREVVEAALAKGAGALVLVHNHPSGDAQPSREDIEMTRAIAAACRPLGIALHDHLIIAGNEVTSFKTSGLL